MSSLHIPEALSVLTLLNIAFVLLAIMGNEFIRRRDARGWQFWVPANVLAVLYFAMLHEWWTLALFAYYFVTSIMGLVHWRRDERIASAQRFVFVRDEGFEFFSSPAMRAAMSRMMARGHETKAPSRAEPVMRSEPRAAAVSTIPLAQSMLIEREAVRIRESIRIVPERGERLPVDSEFAVLARREVIKS